MGGKVGPLLSALSRGAVTIQTACAAAEERADPVAFEVAAQLLVCCGNVGRPVFGLTTRSIVAQQGYRHNRPGGPDRPGGRAVPLEHQVPRTIAMSPLLLHQRSHDVAAVG